MSYPENYLREMCDDIEFDIVVNEMKIDIETITKGVKMGLFRGDKFVKLVNQAHFEEIRTST